METCTSISVRELFSVLEKAICDLRRSGVEEPVGGYTSEQLRKHLHTQKVELVRLGRCILRAKKTITERERGGVGWDEEGREGERESREGWGSKQLHRWTEAACLDRSSFSSSTQTDSATSIRMLL